MSLGGIRPSYIPTLPQDLHPTTKSETMKMAQSISSDSFHHSCIALYYMISNHNLGITRDRRVLLELL